MLTAPQRGNLPLSVVSAGVVEGLLDEGAFEAAALRLLPGGLGYMLSKAPNAREWIATTCLAGGAGETTFVGKTLASALLGAYAGTLREIARFAQAG
ncbi:hypothetical protein ACFO0A_13945 [Novosphingobium tardum]|uniref:Uncharacterized protein n=1 Tax=Novosphingobium tardum TaxID=1538021 RepID=A0ABV8RSM1_9SPHN